MVSKRTQELTSFIVMDVLEKAQEMEREGVHVIHLEVGEPDFDTPACVKAAACRALDEGHTHYTHSLGISSCGKPSPHYYRGHLRRQRRTGPDHRHLGLLAGHPAGLFRPARPGRRGHPLRPPLRLLPELHPFVQGVPVSVPVYEEDGFQFRPEAIREKITARTKAIFINSPSNPTGNLLSAERMQEIAEWPRGPTPR